MRRSKLVPTLEGCPVGTTLTVIGGKWKGILLYHLLEEPRRFGEFRKLYPDITPFMLTLQLRELERDAWGSAEGFKKAARRKETGIILKISIRETVCTAFDVVK